MSEHTTAASRITAAAAQKIIEGGIAHAPANGPHVFGRGHDLVGLGHRTRLRGGRVRTEGGAAGHEASASSRGGPPRRSTSCQPLGTERPSAWAGHRS